MAGVLLETFWLEALFIKDAAMQLCSSFSKTGES